MLYGGYGDTMPSLELCQIHWAQCHVNLILSNWLGLHLVITYPLRNPLWFLIQIFVNVQFFLLHFYVIFQDVHFEICFYSLKL